MASPTAEPTEQEFLDGLSLVDGGIFPAYQEIIDRLAANVPARTATLNTALGLTGNKAIPVPTGYGIAPGVLTDAYINQVVVGGSTTTRSGPPGCFFNDTEIVVYSVGERIEASLQIEDAHLRAAIIRGVLYKFHDGCYGQSGARLWRSLLPTGVSFLPEPFATYAGVACYYKLSQVPDENYWTPLATA